MIDIHIATQCTRKEMTIVNNFIPTGNDHELEYMYST